MRPRNLTLLLVVLLVFGWKAWQQRTGERATAGGASTTASDAATNPMSFPSFPSTPTTAPDAAGVPREAARVLARIRAGGPFQYERDGVVFGNFEGHLPAQPRGYYHEYTVPTPGEHGRGARRIIAGGTPPREFWYTGDHYDSFVRIGDDGGAMR